MDRRTFLAAFGGMLVSSALATEAFAKTVKKKKKVKKPVSKAVNPDKNPGVVIATRSVGIVTDPDEVLVPAENGNATYVKVVIQDKPIKFKSLQAVYSDGSKQDFGVPAAVPVGGSTGWLKLTHAKGVTLAKMEAVYTTGLTLTGTAHALFLVQ
jgi:hypothetical protein